MRFLKIMIALALLMTFTVAPAWADSSIDPIQQELMCQCGCTMVLYSCDCGTAEQMRGEIKTMLGEGKNSQQILDYYVGKYGEKVLAAPTKQGFNLTAYITPFVAIVLAGGVILLILRQWVFRSKNAPVEAPPALAAVEPGASLGRTDLRAQMLRELESYD